MVAPASDKCYNLCKNNIYVRRKLIMSQTIKQCINCENNIKMEMNEDEEFIGYIKGFIEPETYKYVNEYFPNVTVSSYKTDYKNDICPFCKNHLVDTLISEDDFYVIGEYSNYNRDLLLAMIELRKKDVVEFETKMQPFRRDAKRRAEESGRRTQEYLAHKDEPKCPKCGSTSITAGQRGYSLITGFIGSGKTVNRCANCGYKWKP